MSEVSCVTLFIPRLLKPITIPCLSPFNCLSLFMVTMDKLFMEDYVTILIQCQSRWWFWQRPQMCVRYKKSVEDCQLSCVMKNSSSIWLMNNFGQLLWALWNLYIFMSSTVATLHLAAFLCKATSTFRKLYVCSSCQITRTLGICKRFHLFLWNFPLKYP